MHRHCGAIHVQLANDGAAPALQFLTERIWATSPQTQKAHKDVLGWVFVAQECFPAARSDGPTR
jgi:hypothetical protein